MAENVLKLGKQIDIQIQEAHKTSNKMNQKWLIPRHIIIKLSKIKDKEKMLKAAKGKKKKGLVIQGNPPAEFSSETIPGKNKTCQSRILGKAVLQNWRRDTEFSR